MSDLRHVTRKGTDQPVGYIRQTNNGSATVRWGVSDGRVYEEDIAIQELQDVEYDILSPEEVTIRQAREAGGRIIDEGETYA